SLRRLSFTIHYFMPEFWTFWDAARNQPLHKQMQLWQDLYVQPHRGVFNDLAVACKPEFDREWAKNSYFPNLPKITPAMRALSDQLRGKYIPPPSASLRSFLTCIGLEIYTSWHLDTALMDAPRRSEVAVRYCSE